MSEGGLAGWSIMRGLQKNDCQSSAQSIKTASAGEKRLNLPLCCLTFYPCLLYNKEFPSLSGGRDLHAGSAATATGSRPCWYVSLKHFHHWPDSVCNVFFSIWLSCLSMINSTQEAEGWCWQNLVQLTGSTNSNFFLSCTSWILKTYCRDAS